MSNEKPTEKSQSPREAFDENETGIEQTKKAATEAMMTGDYDKAAELVQAAKGMEATKGEMKEDAHVEALEINKGIDDAKAAEEKAAREVALAEQAKLDAEKSQQAAVALLEKMKGGATESIPNKTVEGKSAGPEGVEKEKSRIDEMKAQYNDVSDRIRIKKEEIQELDKEREGFFGEMRKIKEMGNTEGLVELQQKVEENLEQKKIIEMGEKRYEILKQNRERMAEIQDHRESNEMFVKEEREATERHNAQIEFERSNLEEAGLDLLEEKKSGLISEFKEQYGYDRSLAKEIGEKFGDSYEGAVRSDVNRVMMNNFLGTEMPILSKELKVDKRYSKDGKELSHIITNDSREGIYNQSLLARKQVDLWKQATDADEALKGIPKEKLDELEKENKLEYDAIMMSNCVKDIYQPFVNFDSNDFKKGEIIYPDSKLYPKDVENFVDEKYKNHADKGHILAEKGAANERWIKNRLFLQKMAKEKGLLGGMKDGGVENKESPEINSDSGAEKGNVEELARQYLWNGKPGYISGKLESTPEDIRSNKEFMMEAIDGSKDPGNVLTYAGENLRNNKEFALYAMSVNGTNSNSESVYEKLSPELQNDKDIISAALRDAHTSFDKIPSQFKNKEMALLSLSDNRPHLLNTIPKELLNDREVAFAALKNQGGMRNLSEFPENYRNDREFVLEAIKVQPRNYLDVSGNLKNDPDIAFEAVKADLERNRGYSSLPEELSFELKRNSDFVSKVNELQEKLRKG